MPANVSPARNEKFWDAYNDVFRAVGYYNEFSTGQDILLRKANPLLTKAIELLDEWWKFAGYNGKRRNIEMMRGG